MTRPDYSIRGTYVVIEANDIKLINRSLRTLRRKRFIRENAGKAFQILMMLVALAALIFATIYGE